ncbi:hypothetical protein ABTY20_09490 [Streptomyces sp. NPDC126497]|uniref:hypothetical protein n=1 Tax=Streptomyces sp. NPDC126497 TaxID=3155313 RepID=UPI00331F727C
MAGAWPHHYDSFTLFSPARHGPLPGIPFPGAALDRHPHRDGVGACLTSYAGRPDRLEQGRNFRRVRRSPAVSRRWFKPSPPWSHTVEKAQ